MAEAPAGAQTVRRALALLRLMATGQEAGVRLTDLVEMSGLSRPTVHRLLQVLIDEGAVERELRSRRYRIGPELLLLGLARTGGVPIRAVAEPFLRDLARAVGDTVFLTVRHGADSVCVARHLGHHPIQVLSIEVGVRRPLGASVSGVVLLAGLEETVCKPLLESNRPRLERLGLTMAEVRQRVALARRHGHALAVQGVVPGTSALAVPVQDEQAQVAAAISIAAMAQHLHAARRLEVLEHLRACAMAITRRVQEQQIRPGLRQDVASVSTATPAAP
jgi:DNA-binding IclR family transcriptional regulator